MYDDEPTWKTTGRPTKERGVAAAKLLRCLELIDLLKNDRYSVKEIAERFDMSTRTVYRYVNLFDEVGLLIDQDFNKKFFIAKLKTLKQKKV